ncbi:MAG: penicillin-binding protein 2 [Armatimonadota bacterium]
MFFQRLTILRFILLAAGLVFAGRLVHLQLLQGNALRDKSEHNRLRWVRVSAPRGQILDRKGREIATNIPGSAAWLVPGEVPRKAWPQLMKRLVELGFYPNLKVAEEALEDFRHFPSYLPMRLASNMNIETVAQLQESLPSLPGVYVRDEPVRFYPDRTLAAHLIGYLREINAEELAALRETKGYRLGDRLGKTGIERAYEETLRGVEGGEEVEVDAMGRVLRRLRTVQPQPGHPVTLTLDRDLQRIAEAGLVKHQGAVVALDPATGDVLALVSAPEYDLNLMSGRITPEMLAWLHGARKPELNRATCGTYPPGSVFKIVTAVAALEHNAVKPNTYFYCNGVYHGIHCWKRSGHGAISLTEAVAQSCNVAFMQMAEKTGIETLAGTGRRFGLGQTVGLLPQVSPLISDRGKRIGIIPEQRGLVPDLDWAKKVRGSPWMLGETLQVGMGQSSLTLTPLQAARIIAAIANGGRLVHPRLVKSAGTKPEPPTPPTTLGLQPSTIQNVSRGLRAVTAEGTARSLDPSLRIAGKTGTAQNPGGRGDHAWFVGYAPVEAPKIAVAVLVEHGGHGGAVAAPIAEAIIKEALNPINSTAP